MMKRLWIVLICLMLLLSACKKASKDESTMEPATASGDVEVSFSESVDAKDGAVTDAGTTDTYGEAELVDAMVETTTTTSEGEALLVTEEPATPVEPAAPEDPVAPVEPEEPAPASQQSGQLTAGEWSDHNNWEYWLNLMAIQEYSSYVSKWQLNTQNRVKIHVTSNQNPVQGVMVSMDDVQGNPLYSAVTDDQGVAYLFPKAGNESGKLTISYGGEEVQVTEYDGKSQEVSVELSDFTVDTPNVADILFMIDTTGSMGDELAYLQAELKSVITTVASDNPGLTINLSSNYYRDQEDTYVVQSYDFTTDIQTVTNQISEQYSDGGGDYPEAVDQALDNAIFGHQWSNNAKAKLLFLVLDAPPHDDPAVMERLNKSIDTAAEQGIRIIPIASSGVDKETEFILRSFALRTGGTYTFLTNDSGIGNSHIEPTIGAYEVEFLNNLLVRIINQYIH